MIIRSSKYLDFLLRVLVGLAIGGIFAVLLTDGTFRFLQDKQTVEREPHRVDLVIPFGTARQVEAGVANPSIPTNLTFIEGDILVVKNEDEVAHQLGPVWVPPQTSGVLELNSSSSFAYTCSFQPTKYLDIDVRPSLTTGVRVEGMLAVALPTGMILAVYSYMLPLGRKKEEIGSEG